MADHERTGWAFLAAIVCVAFLVLGWLNPWFLYTHSTGARYAPGGPQAGGDTGAIDREERFWVDHVSGNATPTDMAATRATLRVLTLLTGGTIAAAALAVVLEVPVPFLFATRRATLVLGVLGLALGVAALAWCWLKVPPLLADQGADGAFTSKNVADGYVIARLDWGWAFAAIGTALLGALIAFRFGAGSHDPAIVEKFGNPPVHPK